VLVQSFKHINGEEGEKLLGSTLSIIIGELDCTFLQKKIGQED